jgi:hypothetical protein
MEYELHSYFSPLQPEALKEKVGAHDKVDEAP